MRLFCKPEVTSSRLQHQGSIGWSLKVGFRKGRPDLLFAFCSNFLSISYLFEYFAFFVNRKWVDFSVKGDRVRSKCFIWKANPDLLLVFFGNFSSISYRSRVSSVSIPTGNGVITISGIRVYPMDMELADSESACPICYRWLIVNFLYLLTV